MYNILLIFAVYAVHTMKKLFIVICLVGLFQVGYSQAGDTIREVSATPAWGSQPDTLHRRYDWQKAAVLNKPFPVASFIVPAAMIAYGATALRSDLAAF